MLTIRADQMATLERVMVQRFEDEMVAHSRDFSPKLAKVIGDEQLRLAVRAAMARAGTHGCSNCGPVRLFIEMMFLYGSGFDDDPQYPWAARLLASDAPQMDRAELLFQKVLDYQAKVSGPEGANTRLALQKLATLSQRLPDVASEQFLQSMLCELTDVFPEKAAYLGKEALTALVMRGSAIARKAGFATSRSHTMVVALMYAFGHGCIADPLYPWIARTLADPRIVDPAGRANRLERKAMTWLTHVLAA